VTSPEFAPLDDIRRARFVYLDREDMAHCDRPISHRVSIRARAGRMRGERRRGAWPAGHAAEAGASVVSPALSVPPVRARSVGALRAFIPRSSPFPLSVVGETCRGPPVSVTGQEPSTS
jgi:hypothetical protein